MSLLLLLDSSGCPPEEVDGAGSALGPFLGNLRALLDAIHKSDDRIGGRAVTKLAAELTSDEVDCMLVESTIGFGENVDGAGDARLLVGGEIIEAAERNSNTPFAFGTLTRALEATEAQTYPAGTLVYDLARNSSGLDLVRRGLFVDTAVGVDLDVIGRNLGLNKCPGLTEDQWRRIIKAVAYLPKQTPHAFREALEALFDDTTSWTVVERLISDPWTVFVNIIAALATNILGRFIINSGEPQLTTGLTSVDVNYPVILSTLGTYPGSSSQLIEGRTVAYPAGAIGTLQFAVYDDTPLTRRGFRDGFTNYATGGSAAGSTITLGSSPGAAGTPVLVDYTAVTAHYLAADESVRQDPTPNDNWAYLADPLLTVRCLLEQIRAAGIRVQLTATT